MVPNIQHLVAAVDAEDSVEVPVLGCTAVRYSDAHGRYFIGAMYGTESEQGQYSNGVHTSSIRPYILTCNSPLETLVSNRGHLQDHSCMTAEVALSQAEAMIAPGIMG